MAAKLADVWVAPSATSLDGCSVVMLVDSSEALKVELTVR